MGRMPKMRNRWIFKFVGNAKDTGILRSRTIICSGHDQLSALKLAINVVSPKMENAEISALPKKVLP